ncbi:apolipoprotein N-acyltransferase [Jatrophihabitans sp. YIM 134969]
MTTTAPPRRAPLLRGRWAALLAVAGGLVGVLAFPRFGIWPLAAVSVAALSVAVHGHRARVGAGLGMLWGLGFFVPLISWTGIYVGPAPWLILATAEAAYVALLGVLLPTLQRSPLAPLWVGCAWVGQEALRSRWPFGGFPWGRWAFSQADSPLRWFAALGGAPLVSFTVALAGGGLAFVLVAVVRHPTRVTAVARPAAVLVAVPVLALLLTPVLAPSSGPADRRVVVAVVQGNVQQAGLRIEDRARQVLDNHVQATLDLAADVAAGKRPQPDLVVWPENASDVDPYRDATAAAAISSAADTVHAPILVGAILDGPGPDHISNTSILWSPATSGSPGGPGDTYTKRHPVPFAEYIPLRSIARKVSSDVDLVQRDMAAGSGNGLVTGGPFPIGDVICFEVAYDGLVQSSVRAGAQILVVQTNNATFGRTAETYQQLAMSRLRAVETGRTVLAASTSGVSAIIGADGEVEARSGALFTRAVLDQQVVLRTGQTLAVRLGAWPEYVMTAAALLVWIALIMRPRSARRRDRRVGTGGSGACDPATARAVATTGVPQ